MTNAEVKKNVVTSAASGYVRLLVRMGLGLVTFRLLYQGLTPEQFGFWSLLWAIFGYGILLDFGFGYAAQKRVAELMVRQDWQSLSRVLSTIFFFYLIGAAIAVGLGLILSGPLISVFQVSSDHREEFRQILMLFLVGIGLAFPLGIFPEVLQGQQRIALANNLNILSTVANFAGVAVVVGFNLGFTTLVVVSLLCIIIPYGWAAHRCFDRMPGVVIRPSLFSRRTMLETGKFSLFAYANTLSNVLRNKADQPIISTLLGVTAIAPYQTGSKVGEMFGQLTRQIADVLSPTAAHLHARGDREALREMLVNGMRFSVLAATPLYIVSAAYMDGVIRLLTGVQEPSTGMIWAGELLLFWYYSLVLTHWVYKRMFMMAGQERRMMLQGVIEAAVNVVLSITLTLWMKSYLGVAWGSVIPTVVFGWVVIWGWAAKEIGVGRWELFRRVVLRTWIGAVPMIATAATVRLQPWWPSGSRTILVLLEAGVVLAVGAAGLWQLGLTPKERRSLAEKLTTRFSRRVGVAKRGQPA